MIAAALTLLVVLLGSAPLHAQDVCQGGTVLDCFDAGDPDLAAATDVTRYAAADDFVLTTSGEPIVLRVDFWLMQGNHDWDGTLEYFIFEDIDLPSSESGRGPAATSLYAGLGQDIDLTFTGRVGTEVPLLGLTEVKYSFAFEGEVLLNSGQVYWLGLHLSANYNNDFLFWETSTLEPNYPPGIGYGSLRHVAWRSQFNQFSDNPGVPQQLAFKIYRDPPNVPSLSSWGLLAIVALMAGTGARARHRCD